MVVTLDTEIPEVRPGFTCTAEITTATRKDVVAVPIQATTVREMVVDEKGDDRPRDRPTPAKRPRPGAVQASELKPGQSRKELEGVFVVQDAKAQFVPIKTGIAGDKYFEVLSGLQGRRQRGGRAVRVGARAGRRRGGEGRAADPARRGQAVAPSGQTQPMNQFLEAVGIALNAIWTNKLRSFLTVLGNIVAVTSIIAVVSLIQGMNAYVTDAIVSDVGADNFTIQRTPVVRSADDEERVRSNPRITVQDGEAVRKFSEQHQRRGGAGQRLGARIAYGDDALDSVQVQGVSRDYIYFSTFERRARPADQPDRGRPQPRADRARLADGRPAVRPGRSARQGHHHPRPALPGRSASARRRARSSASRRTSSRSSRSASSRRCSARAPACSCWSSRSRPTWSNAAMDDATVAMRIQRRLRPAEPDNFGMLTSDSLLELYHQATNGIFAVLVGVVALSLVVGGIVIMNIMLMVVSERTREIGLRKALGARRRDIVWQILTESVTLSVLGGCAGTLIGFIVAIIVSKLTPLPAAVQFWSVAIGIGITARGRAVLRPVPGDARRAARSDRSAAAGVA